MKIRVWVYFFIWQENRSYRGAAKKYTARTQRRARKWVRREPSHWQGEERRAPEEAAGRGAENQRRGAENQRRKRGEMRVEHVPSFRPKVFRPILLG